MSDLTPNLREEILTFNQRHVFEMVPLIDRSPVAFANRIAGSLTSRIHFEGEFVFQEGATADNMYFISSGICEIVSQFSEAPNGFVKALADGCYFGEVALLLADMKRTAGIRCATSTSLVS